MKHTKWVLVSVVAVVLIAGFAGTSFAAKGDPFGDIWAAITNIKAQIIALGQRIDNIQLIPGPQGEKGDKGDPGSPSWDETRIATLEARISWLEDLVLTPTPVTTPTPTPVSTPTPTAIPNTACGGVTQIEDSRDTNNPVYQTVDIGTQCWLKRNLNVGIRIDGNANQSDNGTIEKYCYSNSTDTNCNIYGGLYQWDEAMNYISSEGSRGICPGGWHIPTDTEFKTLETYLGMTQSQVDATGWRGTIEGDLLKKAGLCNTRTPCGTSGYDALLAGIRYTDGHWDNLGAMESIWTSSFEATNPWIRFLQGASSMTYRDYAVRMDGFSVRCLKDSN